jgi:hypothetical protein
MAPSCGFARTHASSGGRSSQRTQNGTFPVPNLSGVDPQTGKVVRLFDPRRQHWKRHFRWNGAMLDEGKTLSGRTTIRTLRINMPIRVALRQSLIDIGEFPSSDA